MRKTFDRKFKARSIPFTLQLREINTRLVSYYKTIPNKELKNQPGYFTLREITDVCLRWKSRCAFCGVDLLPSGDQQRRIYIDFYVPLERGGPISPENLIITCLVCRTTLRPNHRLMYRLEDIDTIPDLIEKLVIKTLKVNRMMENKDPEYFDECEKLRILKYELNSALEQLTMSLKYNPSRHARIDDVSWFVEEESTVADKVERMASVPEQAQEVREELKDDFRQIEKSGHYRIIRVQDRD